VVRVSTKSESFIVRAKNFEWRSSSPQVLPFFAVLQSPLPCSNKNIKGARNQQGKKTRNNCDDGDGDSNDIIQVPPCGNCGAPRVFEAQILPSILHVLDVDRYAPTDDADTAAAATDNVTTRKAYYNSGGMDFGNIAIYTCSAACDGQEEYVVVQDSVDKQQQQSSGGGRHQQQAQEQRRMYSNEVVVIPEDTKFDDHDEA
jgi:Programmed cell death protein 2, C-terminal putative domain